MKPTDFVSPASPIPTMAEAAKWPQDDAASLQRLLDDSTDWIWQCSRDYHIEYSSPWVSQVLGYTPSQLRGQPLFDLMHPDEVDSARAQFEAHWSRRQPLVQLQCRFLARDGRKVMLETNGMPFSDALRRTQGFRCISRELSRPRPVLAMDEASHAAYDALMEAVAVVGPDLTLTYANTAFLDLFGYTREELPGLSIRRLALNEPYSHHQPDAIADILRTQDTWQGQVKRKTRAGQYISLLLSVRKQRDSQGAFTGYIATYLDLRPLRNTEIKLKKGLNDTIVALARAIENRDVFQSNHQARVADLAIQLALDMGKHLTFIEGLALAARLHDVGKLYLPTEVTARAGPLLPQEIQLMHTHPIVGYQILKDADLPWPVAEIVLQHHERYDGSGYPHGLKGEEILMGARILAVADVVISLASAKSYRPAHDREYCVQELQKNRGIHYDPEVVDVCLAQLQRHHYPLEEVGGVYSGPRQFHTEDA